MKVLVTGSSGRLGPHVVAELEQAGHDLVLFSRREPSPALGHGFRISDIPFPFRYLPVDEIHPTDVEDSYSFSKLTGEELLASYTRAYGMCTYGEILPCNPLTQEN